MAEAVGVGLGFLAIVAPEFWPKMPKALSYSLAGIGLSWLTYSLILGIESYSHMKLQHGPLGAIILGAALVAAGLFWHFSRHDSNERASDAHAHEETTKPATATTQSASLLFEWKWSKLPTAIPAAGTIWTMPTTSQLEFGGQPVLLSPRPGTAGDKLTWGEDNRQYGGVYRCDITNYGEHPIFNLIMTFKTEFFKPEADGSRQASTPVAESYDRPVVIDKLDPKEAFSFYAYSDSRMFVTLWLPKEVTYLRDSNSQRETARLLPQATQAITLFPMTLIEQPKSLPVPPPQAPSQPDKLRKK
jgi:disulfide bond formation protein DsbB